jgi:hypothetical protein
MGLTKQQRRELQKAKRLATVTGVEVFRRTLYGAPFESCPHCGEASGSSQCPHCGYRKDIEIIKGEEQDT